MHKRGSTIDSENLLILTHAETDIVTHGMIVRDIDTRVSLQGSRTILGL